MFTKERMQFFVDKFFSVENFFLNMMAVVIYGVVYPHGPNGKGHNLKMLVCATILGLVGVPLMGTLMVPARKVWEFVVWRKAHALIKLYWNSKHSLCKEHFCTNGEFVLRWKSTTRCSYLYEAYLMGMDGHPISVSGVDLGRRLSAWLDTERYKAKELFATMEEKDLRDFLNRIKVA